MQTLGIDVAAEPTKTALAAIEWSPTGAEVQRVQVGASNADLLIVIRTADAVGIDCPLGWPKGFVELLVNHQDHTVVPGFGARVRDRDALAYRATDLHVWRKTKGPLPLSVSTDRIGRAAIRVAGLLAALEAEGEHVDRSGGGRVAEVYPAAALRQWGLARAGYKTDAATREALVEDLCSQSVDWLTIPAEFREDCEKSDDALDALISALNARAAQLPDGVIRPSAEQLEAAQVEGWIAVPTGTLADLNPLR